MKILVIQQKMIGDVLVSSIICNNLKIAYPNAQVDYMVYASTMPVLEGNPYIDHYILFTERHRKSKWTFLKFLLSIRKEKYDIIIDAYSKLESWITVFLSNATRKISYRKVGRTLLYSDNINVLQSPQSNLGLTIERRLSLLEPLDLTIELDPVPKLYVTVQEKKFAQELFKSHKVDSSKKTVMLSIIGSSTIKTYPLKYMSTIVDFIAGIKGMNMLFNYMPNQIEEAREIYINCKETTQSQIYFNLFGGSLREYIALMDRCDFIIGNDGGAINMAKALQKPSFIVFSPWIEKRVWATFEDGKFHKSVHLKDYEPILFEGKLEKELKKNSLKLYNHFKPDYFLNDLKLFLEYNLERNHKLPLKQTIKKDLFDEKVQKLSIIIITLNEIENIEAVLTNVSFADEIIVVDSYSSDNTVDVIKKYPHVKCIQHKFINFSNQRNFALQQATNNWVLFIDADERVSEDLQKEIIEVVHNPKDNIAYGFYREFYFNMIPLKYGGYQTDKVLRLFNKNYVIYNTDKFVHETLDIKGKTKILEHKLQHYSYKNDSDYKEKLVKYAQLRAKELFITKLNPNAYHFYIKPAYRFLYHYIIRMGFFDGKNGYKISRLNAFEVRQRYIELRKLYNKV